MSETPILPGVQPRAIADLPSGTVNFLFTDIKGSSRLLQQLGRHYAGLLSAHQRLLRAAFQHWSGHEVDTQGDSFFVTFSRAADAVAAGDRFGLITRDQPLGNSTGWLALASYPDINGHIANIAGYPDDLGGVLEYLSYGQIIDSTDHRVFYQIRTGPGESGAGIYTLTDGDRHVFAVDATYGDTANGGTRIDSDKFDSISRWMNVDLQ